MTCPVCNCETKVNFTTDNGDHVIRNRRCLTCGYNFRTVETDEDIYKKQKGGGKSDKGLR